MGYPKGFQKLISQLPKNFTVLDVGSGGLHGENTTEYLLAHFGAENVLGVCWADHEVEVYQAKRAEAKLPPVKIISADFYQMEPSEQYDLVVLDMNIESNLARDWTAEGLERMKKFVKPGGYLINYIMLTDQYGDPEKTPAFIRSQWPKFWETEKLTLPDIGKRLGRISGWEVFAHDIEERRPYILWMLLKRTSGL